MVDPLDVFGPFNFPGILGPGNDEAQVGQASCRFDQQSFKRRLSVDTIGSKITKIPPQGLARIDVPLGIDGAVECRRLPGLEAMLQDVQNRTARKRKINVEERDLPPGEVGFLAAFESITVALASHLRELGSYREAH